MVVISVVPVIPLENQSMSEYAVASSTPATNYFNSDVIDNQYGFETPLMLQNCTNFQAKTVALVENQENSL